MPTPTRQLAPGQSCQVWVHDIDSGRNRKVFETRDILLEAPNWDLRGQELILNGDGHLWRLALASPGLGKIEITDVPPLNNDHVLDPDGEHIFISANDDWHIYRASLAGGSAQRVTGLDGPKGLLHFLHGVAPNGGQLAFVGVTLDPEVEGFRALSAEICTIGGDGRGFRQLTQGAVADGPEYSPDGAWLYLNTETFSGHSQIARMRPDGSGLVRLIHSQTVDWFPHVSPNGSRIVHLAYPTGTRGHPENLWVELMTTQVEAWDKSQRVARLFGGQGTINVNSWSPDSRSFAFVAYPVDGQPTPLEETPA